MIDPQRGGNRVGGGGVANEFLENVDIVKIKEGKITYDTPSET